MRKKSYKGRCEKRSLPKCQGICKTYDAKMIRTYEDVISRNNLQSYFARHKEKSHMRDDVI